MILYTNYSKNNIVIKDKIVNKKILKLKLKKA